MPDETDLQPLLDTQQNQLGILMDVGASIDAKALGMFAATLAVLIFVGQADLQLNWQLWALLLGLFFASLLLNVVALYPRGYVSVAADLADHPDYYSLGSGELILQLLANTDYAIRENTSINQIRWRYLGLSFVFAAVGSLVLFMLLRVQ